MATGMAEDGKVAVAISTLAIAALGSDLAGAMGMTYTVSAGLPAATFGFADTPITDRPSGVLSTPSDDMRRKTGKMKTWPESDDRKWLVTNNLTLGDINSMPFVARLEYLNMLDIFIDERPRVQTWWARSKELSSYKKAIPEMLDEEDLSLR
jgi:Glutathione S-transferase, C-terminal domain